MADIAVAHTTSPYASAYPWSSGFGSKYSNPATLPTGTGFSAAFGTSDIAVALDTSPYVSAYPWSSGFGSKYSDPGTLPTGTGRGVAWFSGGSPPSATPQFLRMHAYSKINSTNMPNSLIN